MSTRGERRHLVHVWGPGTSAAADSEGNWTSTIVPLTPDTWWVSITPASARELERLAGGTTVTTATHVVEGIYRADVTTQSQIVFRNRTFYVGGLVNPEERNIRLICLCQEMVGVAVPVPPDSWIQSGWFQ